MPPQNPDQARVVDPVMTQVARGYRNEALASHHLFPVVPVELRGGTIIEFDAEHFAEVDLRRAPGATRPTRESGHAGKTYALEQRALDGRVSVEQLHEAMAGAMVNKARIEVQNTMSSLMLQVEISAADLATTAANYDADNTSALAGNSRWDNANSTPAKAVQDKKETIRTGVGREPNVLVVGQPVHDALLNNADVISRIKYAQNVGEGGTPIINTQTLAAYFDVDEYVVARARKGKKGAFETVWGKHAIMAFSEVSNLADQGSPSFGYTYRLRDYPIVSEAWLDKSCDSWRYPVTTEDTPVIAGKGAGYLWRTVVD